MPARGTPTGLWLTTWCPSISIECNWARNWATNYCSGTGRLYTTGINLLLSKDQGRLTILAILTILRIAVDLITAIVISSCRIWKIVTIGRDILHRSICGADDNRRDGWYVNRSRRITTRRKRLHENALRSHQAWCE